MTAFGFGGVKPLHGFLLLNNGSGTTITALTASQTLNSEISEILAQNSDTIAHVLRIYSDFTGTTEGFSAINVPAGAGWDGVTPAVDVLAALLGANVQTLRLAPSAILQAAVSVVMTSGTTMTITYFGWLLPS